MQQEFTGFLIVGLIPLQAVITVEYAGNDIDLLQRGQVIIQFQPDIAAYLFNFLEYRSGGNFRLLEFGDQHGAQHQVVVAGYVPLPEILCEISEMQTVDQ